MTRITTGLMMGALMVLAQGCSMGAGDRAQSTGPNNILWDATLSALSVLPEETRDPAQGMLQTGWGKVPGTSRWLKVEARVIGPELDARNLRLAVFRRSGGRVAEAPQKTRQAIEDAILAEAREIRRSAAGR